MRSLQKFAKNNGKRDKKQKHNKPNFIKTYIIKMKDQRVFLCQNYDFYPF